jgi:AcrR family transcriptional regulator
VQPAVQRTDLQERLTRVRHRADDGREHEVDRHRRRFTAEATVFNYFATKEDLFYLRLEAFWERLVEAVRGRAPGEPATVAFRRHVLQVGGLLADVESGDAAALERLRTANRVIAESQTLRAHELGVLARYPDVLAEVLAEETGAGVDDLAPRVAATALMGANHTLIQYVRRRVLADGGHARLAADVHTLGGRAFDNELLATDPEAPHEPAVAHQDPTLDFGYDTAHARAYGNDDPQQVGLSQLPPTLAGGGGAGGWSPTPARPTTSGHTRTRQCRRTRRHQTQAATAESSRPSSPSYRVAQPGEFSLPRVRVLPPQQSSAASGAP